MRWTLSVGLNDKDRLEQLVSDTQAYKILSELAAEYFDGATFYRARGLYTHEDKRVTHENTLRVEVLFAREEAVRAFVAAAKLALNQETIAVCREVVSSELW